MATLQHTPSDNSSSIGKNLIVSIVCAVTVVAVVLMLYLVNSCSITKSKTNSRDTIKATSAAQAMGSGKAGDGWESKPSPLRMIQFIQ